MREEEWKFWGTVGLVASIVNVLGSIYLSNWFALLGWFIAVLGFIGLLSKIKIYC